MTVVVNKSMRRFLPQLITLVAILALNGAVFADFFDLGIANGRFYGSLIDILNRGAPVALLAIGMTLVIASRGIDLSVGAIVAICGAVAASAIDSDVGLFNTLVLSLGVGLLCGLWNGILVSLLDIQPIVATLILMISGRGIAQLVTQGTILTFTNEGLIFIGSGAFYGVPMPVIIWISSALLIGLAVRKTALGILIEAIGINRRASTISGVNSRVLLIAVYVVSGLCSAMAGIIIAADIKGADANNAGLWLELDAILAVVVGGTSLLGGRFSLLGSLLGAMIIQSINTGILLSGYPPEFNLIIKAAIIVIILFIQSPVTQSIFSRLGFMSKLKQQDRPQ
jgi:galactofuranose transport system permease protein